MSIHLGGSFDCVFTQIYSKNNLNNFEYIWKLNNVISHNLNHVTNLQIFI
jgi:hypothetical protein